jgi:hypothetical protein
MAGFLMVSWVLESALYSAVLAAYFLVSLFLILYRFVVCDLISRGVVKRLAQSKQKSSLSF